MYHIDLDSRCRFILDYILKSDGYVRIEDIAKTMNVSKRSVYYDISKINDWLLSRDIQELQTERYKGVIIDPSQKEKIFDNLENATIHSSYYILSSEERIANEICFILASEHPVYMEKLAELCNVSRNTILNDIKAIREELSTYNLKLAFEVKNGYFILGNIIRKRAVFLYYLFRIIHLVNRKLIAYLDYESIEEHLNNFVQIEEELHTEYVEGTLSQLAVLMFVVNRKKEKVEIEDTEENGITKRNEYSLVCKYFPELSHNEQLYFTIHLLGSRVQVDQPFKPEYRGDLDLHNIAANMVQEFEQFASIEFSNREDLINKLHKHLGISFFRYRYGIVEGNPLVRGVEDNYPELFQITRKIADSLSKAIGYPITNSEVAYLTLHFGSYLRSEGNKKGMLRVLLVCPNGISTANMLKKELEDILPIIEIGDVVSLKELEGYTGFYDFIVSTVEIKHKEHAIIVHPILTAIDKQNILSYVVKATGTNYRRDETERVFNIIKEYVPESNHARVIEALRDFQKQPFIQGFKRKDAPGLKELLSPERIQIVDQMGDWKEAINLASKPLIEQGLIVQSYVKAMISNVEEFGSYIFLNQDIALAHARPGDGVIDLSVSMLILKNGVKFLDNRNAKIIIVFAPVDNERHLKVLQEIVAFFSEESNTEQFKNVKDSTDAFHIIDSWNFETN